MMLKQTTLYQHSPALLKLHLYAMAMHLWDVIQQFDELKTHYREWMLHPDNLDLDSVIDYQKWIEGDNLKFPLQGAYPTTDAVEIKKVRESLDAIEKAILDLFSGESFDVDVQSISTALCNEIKCSHLGETIHTMLSSLRNTLREIYHLLSEIRFTDEEVKQFWPIFMNHGQFKWSGDVKKEYDQWKEDNSIDDDEEQLERHFNGKIRVEMELLFKSGFLSPRLKDQEEVDMSSLEQEMKRWRVEEMKEVDNPHLHYSALREFFKIQGGIFVPKEKILSRYILMNRRKVDEEKRRSCYVFIRTLQLLAQARADIAQQQDAPVIAATEPTEANELKPKKKSRPGPVVTQIFTDEKYRQKVAAWIQELYTTYYDKQQKVLIVAEDSYNLTDLLLAIYYVLVERKVTISVIGNNVNNQYYKFLTEECQLEGLASQKTFLEHLNRLVKTGKNFFQLTNEVIKMNAATGGYTEAEYERMKTMTATVKQLLPKILN